MTRDEAESIASRLNEEAGERRTHRWLTRECGDGWEVVRLRVPPGLRGDPLTPTIAARPKPPEPDDPRSPLQRQAPGAWG